MAGNAGTTSDDGDRMILGLISDAHGNHEAFVAGLNLLHERGCAQIYFLGDAVGYIPGLQVVDELHKSTLICVQGNHEAMLLGGSINREKDDVYRLSCIKSMLTDAQTDYLRSWPCQLEINNGDQNILLVHGSPVDPVFGYVYPDTDLSAFSAITADVIFMGNTHHPFIRNHDRKLFVNVGSCGLPRDASGRGSACIYDSEKRTAELLSYDISHSARELLNNPMIHSSVKKHLQRAAGAGVAIT